MSTRLLEAQPTEADLFAVLSDLGFLTMDLAYGAALAMPHLARRMGLDAEELEGQYGDALTPAPRHVPPFPLGARIHHLPGLRHSFEMQSSAVLPSAVNLIAHMPPVRDQQRRSCSVAFATLAVIEHRLAAMGAPQDLSEQFHYWNCKRHDGDAWNAGTYLGVSFPLLVSDGVCREQTWSYVADDLPGNEGQDPPPAGSTSEAAGFRQPGVKALPPNCIRSLKEEVAKGHCVAFTVPVFGSWYRNHAVVESGDIHMPFSAEPILGGHAMCIVGYRDRTDPGNPGGGRFIVRNSWGRGWGRASEFGPGYGTVPYDYIEHYGVEAYTVV